MNLENWTFMGGMKTEAGVDRVVPIHSRIQPLVMMRYKEAKDLGSKYLFNYTDSDGRKKSTKFTYGRYTRSFKRIREDLSLHPSHKPHDGRTHFVTNAKKHRVDDYAIKYIVGHKISDITEKVYTKRELTWLREEIEKIK